MTDGTLKLNLAAAIYGKGLQIAPDQVSKGTTPLAGLILRDANTEEILKTIWDVPFSELSDVEYGIFGKFREFEVDLSGLQGREVYVDVAMLGKSGGIKPVIVDDFYVSSPQTESLSLEKTQKDEESSIPGEFALHQNYPNPFNPETFISFDLPHSEYVALKVYNLLGEEVAEVVNGVKGRGQHTVRVNLNSLPSGIYVYRMTAGSFSDTKRLLLVK